MSHSSEPNLEPFDGPVTQTPLPPIRRSDILNRLIGLCLKEFREILRDRRTIITLLAMPILVYPLLSLVFSRFLLSSMTDQPSTQYLMGIKDEVELEEFHVFIQQGNIVLAGRGEDVTDFDEAVINYEFLGNSLFDSVSDGKVDIAIYRVPSQENRPPLWKMRMLETNASGMRVAEIFSRRLEAFNRVALLGPDVARHPFPADYDTEYVSSSGYPSVSLAAFIPLVLLLMTITGAVYPAIDLTAGERERGTLEALIAAPIPRVGLLMAKYVTVVFIAMLTAVANLSAMLLTIYVGQLESLVFGDQGLTIDVVLQVFGLLVLFAAFFSAILLAVTSFARSFKEAQAYLIPLMLLTIAPGILSLSPTLTLEGPLAATPLINITLMARDIFQGSVDTAWGLIAIATTLLYALTALVIAAQIFGTDAVLYGSSIGWKEFLSRPTERANAASVAAGLSCLASLFIAFFLAVGLLARIGGNAYQKVLLAGVAQALIFLLLPLLWGAWLRLRMLPAFGLTRAPWWTFAVALFLGLTIWIIAHELVLASGTMGWADLEVAKTRALQQLREWRTIPVGAIVVCIGILPAISEELFFRGLLFRALHSRWNVWSSILISSFAFGAFHVMSGIILTPERFLPSLFAGLVLGVVAWRARSTLPGIILHACHNSGLVLLAYYQPEIEAKLRTWNWSIDNAEHLPWPTLLFGLLSVLGSLSLLIATAPRSRSKSSSEVSPNSLPVASPTAE